jgi:predicted ATPase
VTEFTVNDLSELNAKYLVEIGGWQLKKSFDTVGEIFKEIDDNSNYISSFRLHPDRTYYELTKTDLKVGKFGERYTDQIVLWETKNSEKYKELVEKLKEINLLYDIKTKRLEGGRYELLVKPQKNGKFCSLADVGFGISQFLPILVADLQLDDNSFLFVSQPEIHLHPSVQANFADYIINQIKTSKKSYIIETHSEYLINRLRLGIVKEEIKQDDIKSYYFRNDGKNVESFPLLLTIEGQIINAPEDFFKTYMIDIMDIAINSAK